MSTIKVDTIKSRTDTAPTLAKGVIVSAAATFSDDVTIDGALTYDDVTSVDSIGIVTARKGFRATAGGIHVLAGVSTFVGLSTFNDGLIVTSGLTTAGAGLTVTGKAIFSATTGTGTTIDTGGIHVSGVVTATSFSGDGSSLSGVTAGLSLQQAGSWISAGTAATTINFVSGATLTNVDSGISSITLAAPNISTTASSPSANAVVTLDLDSAQHHQLTLTAGITTISCSGGTFGESHSVVCIQPSSGIATVGFSTYFLWPSGSIPNMSEGSSKFDLVSFVIKTQGAVGTGTELLASAGLDYSY